MKKMLTIAVVLFMFFGCNQPWTYCKYEIHYSNGITVDYIEGDIKQIGDGCIEYYRINSNWEKGSKELVQLCGTYQIIKLR